VLITVSWVIASLAVFGAVLNARKNIKGFYIWVVSNLCWIVYNCVIHEYALAVLFGVYTVISMYGIHQWRKQKKQEVLDGER